MPDRPPWIPADALWPPKPEDPCGATESDEVPGALRPDPPRHVRPAEEPGRRVRDLQAHLEPVMAGLRRSLREATGVAPETLAEIRAVGEENARLALEATEWQKHSLFREPEVRPDWDDWALGLALAVARRADCTRRQVGAVILDAEHRVISTGYNGYPSGKPGCATAGACPRGQKDRTEVPPGAPYVGDDAGHCEAIHAEENAVLYARVPLRGATVYVTHKPCANCHRFLAGTGVSRAVWIDGLGWSDLKFEN